MPACTMDDPNPRGFPEPDYGRRPGNGGFESLRLPLREVALSLLQQSHSSVVLEEFRVPDIGTQIVDRLVSRHVHHLEDGCPIGSR